MNARHGNRDFRLPIGTPAPRRTLAAAAEGESSPAGAPENGRSSFELNPAERFLLALAGTALLAGTIVGGSAISVVSLPAALLAPGHVVLRLAGSRLGSPVDAWLRWCLRLILSLATWTVLGVLFVVLPVLDPRWLGVPVGAGLLLLVLATWRIETQEETETETDEDVDEDDENRENDQKEREFIRERVRKVGVVSIFAVVAAASVAGSYLIATGGAAPEPYVSMSFSPADTGVYDALGRVTVSAVVHNEQTHELKGRLVAKVDGRQLVARSLSLEPGADFSLALQTNRSLGCWSRLTVTLEGADRNLAPRMLIAYGPATANGGCQ